MTNHEPQAERMPARRRGRGNQFDYFRLHYGVPAGRGVRILFDGEHAGTILSADTALRVRFDHPEGRFPRRAPLHPTWRVAYLVDDETAERLLNAAKTRRRRHEQAARRYAATGVYHA